MAQCKVQVQVKAVQVNKECSNLSMDFGLDSDEFVMMKSDRCRWAMVQQHKAQQEERARSNKEGKHSNWG